MGKRKVVRRANGTQTVLEKGKGIVGNISGKGQNPPKTAPASTIKNLTESYPVNFIWDDKALENPEEIRCVHCGRKVSEKSGTWVEFVEGGGSVQSVFGTADFNHPGYMGIFPLGKTCAKKMGIPRSALRTSP